jgi:hypothetical protein
VQNSMHRLKHPPPYWYWSANCPLTCPPICRQVKQYRAAIRKRFGLESAIRYIDAGRAAAFILGLRQEIPELWRAVHDVVIERNGRVDLEAVALVVDELDTQRDWSIGNIIAVGSRIGGAAYRLRKLT